MPCSFVSLRDRVAPDTSTFTMPVPDWFETMDCGGRDAQGRHACLPAHSSESGVAG